MHLSTFISILGWIIFGFSIIEIGYSAFQYYSNPEEWQLIDSVFVGIAIILLVIGFIIGLYFDPSILAKLFEDTGTMLKNSIDLTTEAIMTTLNQGRSIRESSLLMIPVICPPPLTMIGLTPRKIFDMVIDSLINQKKIRKLIMNGETFYELI